MLMMMIDSHLKKLLCKNNNKKLRFENFRILSFFFLIITVSSRYHWRTATTLRGYSDTSGCEILLSNYLFTILRSMILRFFYNKIYLQLLFCNRLQGEAIQSNSYLAIVVKDLFWRKHDIHNEVLGCIVCLEYYKSHCDR